MIPCRRRRRCCFCKHLLRGTEKRRRRPSCKHKTGTDDVAGQSVKHGLHPTQRTQRKNRRRFYKWESK